MTDEEKALRITCSVCHAPVGVRCVSVAWELVDEEWVPGCVDRDFHSKRLKRFEKFREVWRD